MKKGRKYRPSNGTEGDCFIEKYCMNCLHCDPNPDGDKQCMILCNTMEYDIDDEEYPSEWTYDEDNNPICTKWQKWDWGKYGDPDNPDNPLAPPPPLDPNQLSLFPLHPNETDFEVVKEVQSDTYLQEI